MITNAYERLFWVVIKVKTKRGNGDLVEYLKWGGLRFDLRNKYDWYFKYRAALLQVKYPKYYVEFIFGDDPPTPDHVKHTLANKIKAKKGKITEIDRKLELARANWQELFPITQHPIYAKAEEKVQRLKMELSELEAELKKML